jgi:signal transduction histidine kinase/CheY-like chemotaxis protein
MATILIVDDSPENRAFLVTLLGYGGHRLLEAVDGADGLALAHAERPDLIISDVLMPTMDGYALVRRLRSDPATGHIPVIFSSAHFLDREADALARACGVEFILSKPVEPQTVLQIVETALQGAQRPPEIAPAAEFDRQHLRVVSDKLRETTDELRTLNQKLAALIDVSQRLAMERDPQHLIESFCHAAREIIGAQCAALAVFNENAQPPVHFVTSGIDGHTAAQFSVYRAQSGPLAVLLAHPGAHRLHTPTGDPQTVGLPLGYPPIHSLLAASVVSLTRTYGWICLTNKLGFAEFSDDDERLASTLAAQLGRIYENGKLYLELQRRTIELEQEVLERKRTEEHKTALLEIAKDIAGTLDFEDLLVRVQRRTAELLPCDAALTFAFDADTNVSWPLAAYGVPADRLAEVMALRFSGVEPFAGFEPVGTRLLNGETLILNDMEKQSVIPAEVHRHLGLTALVAVPLRVRERHFGSLFAVNLDPPRAFEPHQVALLEGIARQLAIALESAELYRERREEAEVAGALAQVGRELIAALDRPGLLDRLCELTMAVLRCDASATLLKQPANNTYRPVAGAGHTPEQWEALRVLPLPADAVAGVIAALTQSEVVQVETDTAPGEWAPLTGRYGFTIVLYIPLRRGDEVIGILAAGFRGSRQRFTKPQEQIARGLARLASLALEDARLIESLERANRLKSDFVATMSHELRTPMNIIMGYNDLLLEGVFGPLTTEQRGTLQSMDRSARKLLDLITATLDLSRLETGRLPLELGAVCFSDLVREMRSESVALESKPGVTFTWNIAPDLPTIRTDALKAKVVLKNLIENAAKFTDAGRVTVDIAARGQDVEICVGDTGVGIDREALPIIFEPFRQVESHMTRRHGGTGLGLYLVRRLLDLLGGTVVVHSAVGRGSTFCVCIPNLPESVAPAGRVNESSARMR